MAGLQRSATTFRRSGSSGLVWDERFLAEAEAGANAEAKAAGDGAAEEQPQPELRHSRSVGSIGMLRRGGGGAGGDGGSKKAKEKEQQKKGQQHKGEDARSDRQVFRTKDVAPDVDPPSPRVSGCILCSIFGGGGSSGAGKARRRSNNKQPRKK